MMESWRVVVFLRVCEKCDRISGKFDVTDVSEEMPVERPISVRSCRRSAIFIFEQRLQLAGQLCVRLLPS